MRRVWYYGASSAGATLLLDLYPATAAYSLRKLRTAYAGSAIRVRRSSDNAEQDIGFVGNDLDTASLLTFVGVGNGFVVTWYDQSGSGLSVIQSSGGAQPQIVASGVTVVRGGKPAVKFDGSNDFLRNISDPYIPVSDTSIISVSTNNVNLGVGTIWSLSSITANTMRSFNDRRTSPFRHAVIATSGTGVNIDLSVVRNSADQKLLFLNIDGSNNASGFDNGATGSTGTFTGTISKNGLTFGVQAGATYLNGTIQEFIAFNTDESANRTAIETNINTHYGIY